MSEFVKYRFEETTNNTEERAKGTTHKKERLREINDKVRIYI